MFTRLLDAFFGCWHNHLSFPITVRTNSRTNRRSPAAALTGTYVVCLDCGKEFAYDWREMKIVADGSERLPAVSDLATKHAG
jgi:hypothetical protein